MPDSPDFPPRHSGSRALRPVVLAVLLAGAFVLYTTVLHRHTRFGPAHVKLIEAAPQTQFRPTELRDMQIYRDVRPAVVSITTRLEQWSLLFGPVPEEGQGSGFIINSNGYILTNFHVIRGATRLRVSVTPAANQTRNYTARVVGTAPGMDLAVIQIPAHNLPTVTLGSSQHLQVGQAVLCIGNPYGLPGTMTHGIISSLRTVRDPNAGIDIVNAIQTDAPVNPGNSGGPMLNSMGQVIGIDSAILSPTHSNIGIGFAIPINQAKAVLHDLITYGHVERPTLGIQDYPVTPYMAQQLGLPVDHGVLVLKAAPNSPAARAGIRGGTQPGYIGNTPVKFGGDVIVAINGVRVHDPSDVARILITHHAGQTVRVTLYRGNKRMTIPVVLGRADGGAGYV